MLSQEQRRAFDEDGLVRLSGAIPQDDALRMADRVREFLAAENPTSRTEEQDSSTTEHPEGFQPLVRAGAFESIDVSAIPAALDDLFGPGCWERPPHWGRPLVTYKVSQQPWDVPAEGWHIHLRSTEKGLPATVNIFVVLSNLRPRGGGTLFLTGSHRLIAEFGEPFAKTKALRKSLGKRDPWLAALWGSEPDPAINRRKRYLDDGAVVDGVPMRVVEATGQPGDAYLMRSDTFHARSPNTLDDPRIMLVGGVSVLARLTG